MTFRRPIKNLLCFFSAIVLTVSSSNLCAVEQSKDAVTGNPTAEHPYEPTEEDIKRYFRGSNYRTIYKTNSLEFAPFIGPLLGEALPNSIIYGARMNYHFNEQFSFEVDGGFSGAGFEPFTFGTVTTEGDKDSYFVNGNLAYHFPGMIYFGKKRLTPTDLFFTAGSGIFNVADSNELSFNIGGGTKVYFNKYIVLRVDIRNYFIRIGADFDRRFSANAMIMLGLSFFLPTRTAESSK